MGDGVVHILSTHDLSAALVSAFGKYGRRPSRVVACPLQIAKWFEDMSGAQRTVGTYVPTGHRFSYMGVPVVPGDKDAQPELIWSAPIEAAS